MKTCSKCSEVKPLDAFHKRLDGYAYMCKACKSDYAKKHWGSRNDEKIERDKVAAKRNHEIKRSERIEYIRKYQTENAESIRDSKRRYYQANKHIWSERRRMNLAADVARVELRRAKALRATPSWANAQKIAEIYEFSQEFRDAGFDVHVDHIVPLQGKGVSGLHVEQNLRVCLATANLRKGNRHTEQYQ